MTLDETEAAFEKGLQRLAAELKPSWVGRRILWLMRRIAPDYFRWTKHENPAPTP